MQQPRGKHVPVLLERCLDLLAPALTVDRAQRAGGRTYHVDATLGLGGHAEAVLQRHPETVLIGLDRDTEALEHSRRRLAPFADRVHLVHAVYDELPRVLRDLRIARIDSILFDLGVSSLQLDEADRGFAYAQDAPLDMRMDQTRGMTAEQVVNTYDAGQLARVLRVYGEEKFASRIAASILKERAKGPLTSSARLAELVRDAIPAAARRTGGHPAKRTFQALRIEVNRELVVLEAALPAALDVLTPGGRIVVMSYHS
ncbi:MAG: 16S rRNA (cytosine(1402)-N(4))-methyltransferase RsmH, partial [Hamadaea sp.]|nr:16S rRNA (cytosine(1402)-N(4))-methyltransferase RsmH [Hamadaea sp.]